MTAPAAHASAWGYDHVTPAGDTAYTPAAVAMSKDLSTALVTSFQLPMDGRAGDGRAGPYLYALRGAGWVDVFDVPAGVTPEVAQLILQMDVRKVAADGSRVLVNSPAALTPENTGFYLWSPDDPSKLVPVEGDPHWKSVVGTSDLGVLAFGAPRFGTNRVVRWTGDDGAQTVSVDDNGDPMPGSLPVGGGEGPLTTNYLSADGTKVLFESSTALDGDTDTAMDIYQRDVVAGTTTLISDATPGGDPDVNAGAQFRWASADHGVILWRTTEQLTADDTDNASDLYVRDGGTIKRVSLGETVDGVPTGNANAPAGNVEWVATSEDGDRVFFVTQERLTQDAPASGDKLYEHDRSEGRTRFVAGPLAAADVSPGGFADPGVDSLLTITTRNHSFRGIRVTSDGAYLASAAQLTADDTDAVRDVYQWTRGGGLRLVSKPAPGAPPSAPAPASFVSRSLLGDQLHGDGTLIEGGRGVTDDGRMVFITTAESLTAEDTDGGRMDVYAASADGTIELVSPPGGAQEHATYVESAPDGSAVFIETTEAILPGDLDGVDSDLYVARRGGGSAPSAPVEPVPAGPGGPAGALPQVPSLPVPASGSPKAPEPGPGSVGPSEPDDGARPGRASLSVRAAKRVDDGKAVLVARASADGELRVRGVSRLRKRGERRNVRVASETADVVAGERTRVSLSLSNAALQRLERRGRLRVRFVLRLRPSGEERPARERVTVVLRSAGRR